MVVAVFLPSSEFGGLERRMAGELVGGLTGAGWLELLEFLVSAASEFSWSAPLLFASLGGAKRLLGYLMLATALP